MNTKVKRSQADRVLRRANKLLETLGFRRTRSRFWIRQRPHAIEFVHLHLFSFAPAFRVHMGLRVLNDPFEAPALNGPHSESHRGFHLEFDDSEGALDQCANQIRDFVLNVGEPWFRTWSQDRKLLDDPASPLSADAKGALRAALAGAANPANIKRSRTLLGAA